MWKNKYGSHMQIYAFANITVCQTKNDFVLKCKRTSMAVRYEIFVKVNESFIAICNKTNMTDKQGINKWSKYERLNIASKCKILVTVT